MLSLVSDKFTVAIFLPSIVSILVTVICKEEKTFLDNSEANLSNLSFKGASFSTFKEPILVSSKLSTSAE